MYTDGEFGHPLCTYAGEEIVPGRPMSLHVMQKLFSLISSINLCECGIHAGALESEEDWRVMLRMALSYVEKDLEYHKQHAELKNKADAWQVAVAARVPRPLLHEEETVFWRVWLSGVEQHNLNPRPTGVAGSTVMALQARTARVAAEQQALEAQRARDEAVAAGALAEQRAIEAQTAERLAERRAEEAQQSRVLAELSAIEAEVNANDSAKATAAALCRNKLESMEFAGNMEVKVLHEMLARLPGESAAFSNTTVLEAGRTLLQKPWHYTAERSRPALWRSAISAAPARPQTWVAQARNRVMSSIPASASSSGDRSEVVVAEKGGAAADGEDSVPEGAVASQPQAELSAAPSTERSRQQLWKAAIKLPMYSVALIPLTVGTAVAFATAGAISCQQFFGVLLASVLIIAWLNLSNDAFDADTGVDSTKPESVVNLLGGNKARVLLLANLALAAGVAVMAHSMASVTDGRVFAWLAAAVACGYVYQGPPFRLSYKGLGEPLCFAAFGPLATGAFFLAQVGAAAAAAAVSPALPPLLWVCATAVGISTTAILFCSHFHQIEGDLAAGKMSPLVRLGTARASRVLKGGVLATYGLLGGATAAGCLPVAAAAVCTLSLPAARDLVQYVETNHAVPAKMRTSKLNAIHWHCALGACLCIGLLAGRLQPALLALLG
eukprot:jgi/Tetstr1/466490/TSEL_010997.t1